MTAILRIAIATLFVLVSAYSVTAEEPRKPRNVSKADLNSALRKTNKQAEPVKTPASANKAAIETPVEPDKHAKLEEAAEPSVEPPTFTQNVSKLVLKEIKKRSGGYRRLTQGEWSALRSLYDIPDPKLLWVGEQGVTAAVENISAEIRRADDYGLRASDFKLPRFDTEASNIEDLARAELQMSRAVLTYARHAKGGRIGPGRLGLQRGDQPPVLDPETVLKAISATSDPAAYLRSLHPKHPQFAKLREKLLDLRKSKNGGAKVTIPRGPVLRRGVTHAQVELLRKRLGIVPSNEEGRSSTNRNQFDEAVEKSVIAFQRKNGLAADGIVGAGTRRILNGDTTSKLVTKLLINMERWRWLPEDLDGEAGVHVWANIPEFRVRVLKEGQTVFSEKAIVGKVSHKTPVFSDEIEWIEFHPTWYVPDSIKVGDILPSLRRPTSTVMERYNLRVDCGPLGRNPKAIDWQSVDIRKCSFTQPPGPKSVLGDFKFKFPNKHIVYMHDTHNPGLFNAARRAYSHGCIRVKNPRTMAEILLNNDKGMSAERIGEILAGPRRLHKEAFNRAVPVHITYFTALFGDDGAFITRPDYYGHDSRLARILTGKSPLAAPLTAKRRAKVKTSSAKKKTN